jgi:cytidine deaminase
MRPEIRNELVAAALQVRRNAMAPYSGFLVGAAVRTRLGRILTGVNVESASYGLTCCAERVALFKALSEGERDFAALAVVARWPKGPMPCGACRQLLAEYAPAARIWIADSARPGRVRTFSVPQLLPHAFQFTPARRQAGSRTQNPARPRR